MVSFCVDGSHLRSQAMIGISGVVSEHLYYACTYVLCVTRCVSQILSEKKKEKERHRETKTECDIERELSGDSAKLKAVVCSEGLNRVLCPNDLMRKKIASELQLTF